ncbi:anti-sigma factor antagonist [Kitasatospora sp. NBC_00240]|uniref:anti-sigma factor antagonist n=1 Tax=Kitasatospora sp. NBC_00240 TaxID=2903567 RepID=UPI0022500C59|nr:anti-sigma factor antagonist [Kitasatospora sp. NBC_00240]MCX5214211.1 anti-sigma factor antagonist [Kitasatospora sp. NBC_00240]
MQLTISRDDPDLGRVEEEIGGLLSTLPLAPDAHHQVITAVLEAVSNAVRHGRRSGGLGSVLLEAEVADGHVVVTVTDDGPGFDPGACPDPRTPERLLLPGGRGVFLMHHLMDGVDFAFPPDGGTRVTLRKSILATHGSDGGTSEGEPLMQISTRKSGDVTVLDFKGRITIGVGDVALRSAVREALESGATKILLNLADVTAIDSSGVGELVSCYTTTNHRGAKLALLNLPPKVQDILYITQLISVFNVYDNEDEAVQGF